MPACCSRPAKGSPSRASTPDIEDLLLEPAFSTWEIPLLRKNHVRYVVADCRKSPRLDPGLLVLDRGRADQPEVGDRQVRRNPRRQADLLERRNVRLRPRGRTVRGHGDLGLVAWGSLLCAVRGPGAAVAGGLAGLRRAARPAALPGYAIVAATFARRRLDPPRLLVLSLALSLAVLALGGSSSTTWAASTDSPGRSCCCSSCSAAAARRRCGERGSGPAPPGAC